MDLVQVDEVLVLLIRRSLTQYFYKIGTLSNSDHSSVHLKQNRTLKIGTLRSSETLEEIYCSTRWNNAGVRNPSNTQSIQSKGLEFCFVRNPSNTQSTQSKGLEFCFVQINLLGSFAFVVE
jgi:hypothetical protein